MYAEIEIGLVSGSKSIQKSTSQGGGTPGKSSQSTSWNSFTIGTESMEGM